MSSLSDLVYGKDNKPWPYFVDKYPVKVKQITGLDNDQLERDIRDAGDHLWGRTPAKCLMTRWDMHDFYNSFVFVADKAIEIADACPLATKTDTDGNPSKVPLYVNDTWGLIYNKGQSANEHTHWPSLWSYTYCVFACEKCSPLVFPNAQEPLSITPKTSQMIVFPAWLKHEVPTHTCEHDRIMISGNLWVGDPTYYTKIPNAKVDDSFVRGFENALSKELCQSLIEWFESEPDVKTKEVNRETRKDKQMWLPESSELYKPIQKVKLDMLGEYLTEFPYAYRGTRKLLTPEIKIQRTNPMGGGFHNFHAEVSHWENCSRALVWTIYLNDVPNGEGETEFLYDKIRIQPKEGMGCIFPAAWMYQHRGNPVHTHPKYIATGWYWYPEEHH